MEDSLIARVRSIDPISGFMVFGSNTWQGFMRSIDPISGGFFCCC